MSELRVNETSRSGERHEEGFVNELNKFAYDKINAIEEQKEHLERQLQDLEKDVEDFIKQRFGKSPKHRSEHCARVRLEFSIVAGVDSCPYICWVGGKLVCSPKPC